MPRWMYVMIVVGLGSIVANFLKAPDLLVFSLACAGLIPMAALIGHSTESLAHRIGPKWGGLLNATFGNAAELIILIAAIQSGLFTLAKASITGSIIGNILLVLGASILLGGLKNGIQTFDGREAGRNATMLLLATFSLLLPATYQSFVPDKTLVEEVSIAVALVLLVLYGAYIVYGLTSKEGSTAEQELAMAEPVDTDAHGHGGWGLRLAMGVLVAATIGTAIFAELLVHTVETVTHQLGWSEFFVGVIIVPLVGNVAEHVSALQFAYKNKMDISQAIAAGSSTQIALLVAPLAVLISLLFHPLNNALDLAFNMVEVIIVGASALVFAFISVDGETNWLEGLQLLGLYVIAAVVFFFLPGGGGLVAH